MRLLIILSFISFSLFADSPLSKKDLEKEMTAIKKPYKKLKKLAKAQRYTDKLFKKYSLELIAQSQKFLKSSHDEKEFLTHQKDYRKNLLKLKSLMKKKKRNKSSIKKSFLSLKQSCTNCHDDYKEEED